IAMQMGHTDTAMIDKHYGEWITDDSPDYANASAKHLAGTFGQSLPADETEVSGEVIIQNDEMALVKILQTKPELLAAVKMLVGSQS
ncbi:TPA: tyrosine-type recombinase/integrase, partial [Vibrio alginolyticus]